MNKGKAKETHILTGDSSLPAYLALRLTTSTHLLPADDRSLRLWLGNRSNENIMMQFIHILPKFLGSILNAGRISTNCTPSQSVEATDGGTA